MIWEIGYKMGFSFIGVIGKDECTEKRSIINDEAVTVVQIFYINADASTQSIPNTDSTSDVHFSIDQKLQQLTLEKGGLQELSEEPSDESTCDNLASWDEEREKHF